MCEDEFKFAEIKRTNFDENLDGKGLSRDFGNHAVCGGSKGIIMGPETFLMDEKWFIEPNSIQIEMEHIDEVPKSTDNWNINQRKHKKVNTNDSKFLKKYFEWKMQYKNGKVVYKMLPFPTCVWLARDYKQSTLTDINSIWWFMSFLRSEESSEFDSIADFPRNWVIFAEQINCESLWISIENTFKRFKWSNIGTNDILFY